MLKRILLTTLFLITLLSALPLRAADRVTVYFFWNYTCPHCKEEAEFLKGLEQKYPQVELKDFEITRNRENAKLFEKVCRELGNSGGRVPYLVVGDQPVLGFLDEQTTGALIEGLVQHALNYQCVDVVAPLLNPRPTLSDSPCPTPPGSSGGHLTTVNLPFIGQLELKRLSLPTLSVVLGLLDGFNPCAMWALLFLISLLLGMENVFRRWVLGVVFIITSAAVYFLFMTAWLNLFLFLGLIDGIRIAIGLAAVGIAGYNLRDYWVNREAACKVGNAGRKQKIFSRLRKITEQKNFLAALLGIILLAFAVNLIELICSAGLPAVFTHLLSLSELPGWQYYTYLLIYIFFFMLDDLVVFTAAMLTLKAVGLETKYARYSRLFGGILILIIGLLLLLKPEVLMLG